MKKRTRSDKSSDTSTISTQYVMGLIEKFKASQHCVSTDRVYHNVWTNFNKFLIRLDHKPSTWEDRAALYGAYLVENGVQSSTLKSYVSAIKKTLVLDGYDWCDEKLKLCILTNSCRRNNDRKKTRLPIQNGLLELILFETERYFTELSQLYLEKMYKTIFMLLYYGLFRIGELASGSHPVLARDVFIAHDSKKMLFLLRSSKTHLEGAKPQQIKIEGNLNLEHKSKTNYYCPYLGSREFLALRGDYVNLNDPLFVFSDGSLVRPHHVRKTLRTMIKAIKLDPSLYDTHSFRSGRATDLQKAGYSVDFIKRVGRWRSNAVYNYLK